MMAIIQVHAVTASTAKHAAPGQSAPVLKAGVKLIDLAK
jgi:hypothetical protein